MPIIQFETVTKEFTADSYGVTDVSFSIEPGEIIFITGPSGSGKTTLMRLLTKEYTPTTGEIFFNQQPLSDLSAGNVHNHRRKIGVVFQDYQLVPEMNVWENIALPLYVSGKPQAEVEKRVTDLLNLIKLPEKADQFPSQLSGGEAQRVSIARALSVGPEVIFADEPTGNLDPETSQSISRLLKKINELGTTILIATHDSDIMKDSPDLRHIKLENGKLIFDSKNKSKKTDTKSETKKDAKSTTSIEISEVVIEESAPQDLEVETAKPSFWSKLFGKKKEKEPEVSEEQLEEKPKKEADSKSDSKSESDKENMKKSKEKREKDSKKSK